MGASGAFRAVEKRDKPKYYCLSMFPYPSGELHMGHVRKYTIGDVLARYPRKRGLQRPAPDRLGRVGLPAENAAITDGVPPAKWTAANIAYMQAALGVAGYRDRLADASSQPASRRTTAGTSGSSCAC